MIKYVINLSNENYWNDFFGGFYFPNNIKDEKKDDMYEITLSCPGVDKDDIELTISDKEMVIKYNGESIYTNKFHYTVDIDEYEPESLKTEFKNGVLKLILDKKESLKPKKIKI